MASFGGVIWELGLFGSALMALVFDAYARTREHEKMNERVEA